MSTRLTVRQPKGGTATLTDWGLNSDYGTLRDVLLGPIDNYRWLETSAISKRSFRLGLTYNHQTAQAQYREILDVYEQANVTVHTLPADAHLPYQLFARDSSVMTPWGAIVTQMHHPWRRGEYAPVLQFYQDAGIPIYDMVTASAFEGGDFNLLEPGVVLCGYTNDRTQEPAMLQIKEWIEAEGWEFRPYQLDPFFVHVDALVVMLADKLAAVCSDALEPDLIAWLKGRGIELIDVSFSSAIELGCNVVALGDDRVLLPAASTELKEKCKAHGLTVYDPQVDMITGGGGGLHCMCQSLRRDLV
ncbi:dimethylarginine dimethylaminohydrolase family protein [Rhodovibrionaceae bacterium A322]